MKALSDSTGQLESSYGAVVVGSGYGGAITAARLAQAGHAVCILERGREWAPGRFPDAAEGVLREMRTQIHPLGLYDYHAGGDIDVLSGSGLGGTSLINANVAIRPHREVFAHARWPAAIRRAAESGELDRSFDEVATMLALDEIAPDEDPLKLQVHAFSAARRAQPFQRMRLAVNLRRYDEAPNHVGVAQRLCTGCGDCVTGCNVSAKNTLYMNYLPLARLHGAEIFTQVEVDFVIPAPDGYYVFVRHHPAPCVEPVAKVLHARVVVLAAGSLGTTGILLRSRERGLPVSRCLGRRFTTNGDQLGMAYNNDRRTNVNGFGAFDAPPSYRVGPTITGMIDYRPRDALGGFIIEEGAIPRALVDILRRIAPEVSLLDGVDTDSGALDKAHELARVIRDQLRRDSRGALNSSMVYLGMGHDGADGRILLDPEGRPRVLWGAAGERPVFRQISDEMSRLSTTLGGTYVENPRWTQAFGRNPITVHPLGGCPMGEDADSGAVNHHGQLFRPDGGLHEGLFVADAAVIPTSLGVNPFFTISALAERIAAGINAAHAERRIAKGRAQREPWTTPAAPPVPAGLEFTEEMRGFITPTITDAVTPEDYEEALTLGHAAQCSLGFRLTILIDDIERFIESREHAATAEGYIDSALFGKRLLVQEGVFNLFLVDTEERTKRMIYKLEFQGDDGERYLLSGFKEIFDDPGIDAWADNTRLFTTIHRGSSEQDPVVAQGIVHITPASFLKQLTTFRVRNCPSLAARGAWLARFGAFFFGELWGTYVQDRVPGADAAA